MNTKKKLERLWILPINYTSIMSCIIHVLSIKIVFLAHFATTSTKKQLLTIQTWGGAQKKENKQLSSNQIHN